jgi:uncharacterized protein DUF3558
VRRILLVLAALAAAAGCSTTTVAGSPAPAPAPAAAESDGIALAPRSRDLPLDEVDPCALLTAEQRGELGLEGEGVGGTSDEPLFAGRQCSFRGYASRPVVLGIALATGNGIEVLIAPGTVSDELTPITVAGLPAVLARPRLVDSCSVDIDVAPGQFIDVQLADGGGATPIPQDALCRDVVGAAERVARTLQNG